MCSGESCGMDKAAGVTTMPAAVVTATAVIPQQADSDAHLVALWLHGHTARTLAAYASEARAFLVFAAKPLRAVTLGDLGDWQRPRGFLR